MASKGRISVVENCDEGAELGDAGAPPVTDKLENKWSDLCTVIDDYFKSTGKDNNIKKKVIEAICKSEVDQDEESSQGDDEESTSEESTTDEDKHRKRVPRYRKIKYYVDNRRTLEMEVFKEDYNVSFEKYLTRFEEYCREIFGSKKYLWIGELEKHLTGKLLLAFQSMRGPGEEYNNIKKVFLSWYKEEKEERLQRARKKFNDARYKSDEGLFIYSNRLSNLYKLAYPNMTLDNDVLFNKFKSSVPRDFKAIIKQEIFSCKLKGKNISWEYVQKCARLQDLEQSEEEEDDAKTIVVNMMKEKKEYNEMRYHNRKENDQRRNNMRESRFENARETPRLDSRRVDNRPYVKTCVKCRRRGHELNSCWYREQLCEKCGSNEHFTRYCSRNYPQYYQHSDYNNYAPPQQNDRRNIYDHQRSYNQRGYQQESVGQNNSSRFMNNERREHNAGNEETLT